MLPDVPVVQIARVVRSYQALRPLRLAALSIKKGERVALSGLDVAAAEVLIDLLTGAALPDEGDVLVFGRSTREISSGDDWLASLEQYGIVSPRAVLIEGATIQQNLAMSFSLQIDPVPPEIAGRVAALAAECGIATSAAVHEHDWLDTKAGEAPADVRTRLHFARAIALDPALVLLEHPTVEVDERSRAPLADDMARVLERRGLTTLVITQDETFASRVAHRVVKLHPATGELRPVRKGWFG